jgi:hypothetical protein
MSFQVLMLALTLRAKTLSSMLDSFLILSFIIIIQNFLDGVLLHEKGSVSFVFDVEEVRSRFLSYFPLLLENGHFQLGWWAIVRRVSLTLRARTLFTERYSVQRLLLIPELVLDCSRFLLISRQGFTVNGKCLDVFWLERSLVQLMLLRVYRVRFSCQWRECNIGLYCRSV